MALEPEPAHAAPDDACAGDDGELRAGARESNALLTPVVTATRKK